MLTGNVACDRSARRRRDVVYAASARITVFADRWTVAPIMQQVKALAHGAASIGPFKHVHRVSVAKSEPVKSYAAASGSSV